MWQGQQPPGGEQNPQQQNPYQQPGYQQPNPYQQPGYQQSSPYQQAGQPGRWSAPTAPSGVPQASAGDGGSGGGNRTKVVAIVAATAVVVAAGVTGFLLLGDKDDDKGGKSPQADGKPSRSAAAKPGSGAADGDDSERGTAGDPKPTVPGWQVVVNPRWGTAFDVPPDWDVRKPGAIVAFEDVKTGKPLMTMSAPAYFKSKWCTSDEDRDGRSEDKALGAVGTKGANGAKNTDEVAVNQVAWWVFGGYTQPDKKSLFFDEKAKPYTTKAGIKGSIAWSRSQHTPQKGKCASDGKAITFGFKNAEGDFVAWSLYGAKGVKEEIPTKTIMKILSTVRLHGDASES
ncbi:hypothetical protein [Streptomyces spectabilis]|uniref:DUF8017 domain-containing protein n=1 Tax=Streptomyces spectabilis TaxID=68270 RepID=A0A5P2X294_STRST|nr:hypothetical protein [Streptomyces spectabilis]MBB5108235.1 hypothetical protein [Streptomyces spectabilis]MCI3900997.1 hypothetical protein [Streptomyces spectabilis]QEV58498.1 hypothetical protein CP982_07080 [Streptomyces spectabilis]GGV45375.1 hypothetical protein GCM10010245_70960 [Streptomyces spectabilis]